MKRFFLSSFATRANHDCHDLSRAGQFMPPLVAGQGVLNFDYSLLLVCGSLIMDRTSFDVMTSKDSGMPETVREQVRILHEEGFIELRDYMLLDPADREKIEQATAQESQELSSWDAVSLGCIDSWFSLGEGFGPWFERIDASGKIPYILNEYMGRHGDYDNVSKAKERWAEIKVGLQKGDPSSRKALDDMNRILLDYIHTGIVLANRFDARNYEWDNLQDIFHEKLRRAEQRSNQPSNGVEAEQFPYQLPASTTARQFISLIIPYRFDTSDMSKALKLLKDRRIENVREVVRSLDERGVGINDALKNDFTCAILEANHNFHLRRKIDLFAKGLRLVLGLLPGGGTAVEVGHSIYEGMTTAMEIGAEEVADRVAKKYGVTEKKMEKAMWVIHRNLRKRRGPLLW